MVYGKMEYIISKRDYGIENEIIVGSSFFNYIPEREVYRVPYGMRLSVGNINLKLNGENLEVIIGKQRKEFNINSIDGYVILIKSEKRNKIKVLSEEEFLEYLNQRKKLRK